MPHRRLRAREQVRELGGELERAEAAHRVAGDRRAARIERVARGDVGPHLEGVGSGEVAVEAVGPAALRA